MATHKTYQLYADLFENGRKVTLYDLSEDERDAVLCEIEDLWMDIYHYTAHRQEFVAVPSQDDEDIYLLLKEDGFHTHLPLDCLTRELTIGAPKINERTLKLVGDRIPLRLPGFPARRIEVLFSDL